MSNLNLILVIHAFIIGFSCLLVSLSLALFFRQYPYLQTVNQQRHAAQWGHRPVRPSTLSMPLWHIRFRGFYLFLCHSSTFHFMCASFSCTGSVRMLSNPIPHKQVISYQKTLNFQAHLPAPMSFLFCCHRLLQCYNRNFSKPRNPDLRISDTSTIPLSRTFR